MDALARLTVRSSVLSCERCALCKVATRPVPFRGPSPASIAVIGEAPGKVEDAIGKPFVGPSGNLANGWLRDAGIDPDQCAWLNVVSCFPNRTPAKREVESCSPNVDSQLGLIQPQWIIMFGGVATGRWWPGIRMGDIRGKFWQIDIPASAAHAGLVEGGATKSWVMATWHPAAVMRNRVLEKEVLADIRRFRRVVTLQGRDPLARDRGAMPYPFNYECLVCGALGDRWLEYTGTESLTGEGALALCSKHWDTRMGTSGGGRATRRASSAASSSKGQPKPPRKVKPTQETMI